MKREKTTFDPLRRITVPLTPEEAVRQWFIKVLSEEMHVPQGLMNSEVGFSLGGKAFRADILVWDRIAQPLAIVECKAPSVPLDSKVLAQAQRYNMALGPSWIFLTNGTLTYALHKEDGRFVPYDRIPDYEEMLSE